MDQTCLRHTSRWLVGLLLSGLITCVAGAQTSNPAAATPTPAATPAPGATQAQGAIVPPNATQPAGPTVEAPEPSNKVVLKVGDQQFTKADIDFLIESLPPQAQRALATQGKKPLGDQFVLIVLLSRQAQLHHLDQSPAFVHKLALQKQQMEAQVAFEEINRSAQVTPEEIQQYYTAHAADYEEITVRQFAIREKAANAQAGPGLAPAPAGPGLTPEEAKARAEAIRKELIAGADIKKIMEDFKAPGEVIIEPEPRKVRRGGMRPEMEKVAFALKDGEVSEPVDAPQALVFFQVTKHSHPDVKDITPEIEKSLRQQKIDAALANIKKSAAVWMDEQYFGASPNPQERPTMGAPVVKTPTKP